MVLHGVMVLHQVMVLSGVMVLHEVMVLGGVIVLRGIMVLHEVMAMLVNTMLHAGKYTCFMLTNTFIHACWQIPCIILHKYQYILHNYYYAGQYHL